MEPISSSVVTSPALFPTFACLFATFRNNGIRNYEGYKVYRINVDNAGVLEALKNVYEQEEYDFWSPPSMTSPTDVLVPPQQVQNLESFLGLLGADFQILRNNVQYDVEYEQLNHIARVSGSMNWNAYHRISTIHSWMEGLATQYPDLVTIFNAGNSSEGRPLKIMKISNGGANSQKPAIWLDGGIHAREWVSPATVTYMANELITSAVRHRQTKYLDAFDFYIHPVMNPDGYEFTHTFDRLWRKTRSGGKPIFGGLFGCCKGVDPNRNWDYKWGGKGTSKNACSQVYHGTSAASEPEVSSIQDFILARKDQIKLFLTFHSYSQLLLLPWGYDNLRTDDYDDLMRVGDKALKALASVHGTTYTGGPTAEILYPAAGGSHDWAKAVAGIKFAYCYELRDTGKYGFILPANQIVPTGEEMWVAVQSMADDVMDYYNMTTTTAETASTTAPVSEDVSLLFANRTCGKADEENCLVRFGEKNCDCVTSLDSCFLPRLPSGRCKSGALGFNCCSKATCDKCCCCKVPVCECMQLINCKAPNKPYGFCKGSININCCNVPPDTQCIL